MAADLDFPIKSSDAIGQRFNEIIKALETAVSFRRACVKLIGQPFF
jgi:hypothetical protein